MIDRSTSEYQDLIDKLLAVIFGTIGGFPARVVGAHGSTVYVCTSSKCSSPSFTFRSANVYTRLTW